MEPTTPDRFDFDVYRLDLAAGLLQRADQAVALRPKTWSVLCHLVRNAGRLVPTHEIFDAIWPDTAITPQTLTNVILELRRVFGDSGGAPRFIETVPRRGFRFVASVRRSAGEGNDDAATRGPATKPLFVGREPEMEQLKQAWRQALSGRSSVVFVTGETGIGKTTLLHSLLDAAHSPEERPCLVGGAVCLQRSGTLEPYLPVLQVLAKLVARNRHGAREMLALYAPNWHAQLPWLVPAVDMPAPQQATAGIGNGRLLLELVTFLEALSQRIPLLLALDDLHWADGPTLDLLATLAQRNSPARVMLVGSFHPANAMEHAHPVEALADRLCARAKAGRVHLRRFDADTIASYLTRRFGDADLTARLSPAVESGSNGNPLFVEAIVNELLERSWIVVGEGRASLGADFDPKALAIPEYLRRTIERQLSALDAETVTLLEAASVVGVEFALDLLAAAVDRPVDDLERACRALTRRGLLIPVATGTEWPDGSGRDRYAFKHALHHGVLYDCLPARHRAVLHHAVGERLELAYAMTPLDAAAELARHFERGGNPVRAERYRLLAATHADGALLSTSAAAEPARGA